MSEADIVNPDPSMPVRVLCPCCPLAHAMTIADLDVADSPTCRCGARLRQGDGEHRRNWSYDVVIAGRLARHRAVVLIDKPLAVFLEPPA